MTSPSPSVAARSSFGPPPAGGEPLLKNAFSLRSYFLTSKKWFGYCLLEKSGYVIKANSCKNTLWIKMLNANRIFFWEFYPNMLTVPRSGSLLWSGNGGDAAEEVLKICTQTGKICNLQNQKHYYLSLCGKRLLPLLQSLNANVWELMP